VTDAGDQTADKAALLARLRAFEGRQVGPPLPARDPVNQAMIRHWCDAMGDALPVYTDPVAAEASIHGGIVAPPAMLQAWAMQGYAPPVIEGRSGQDELLALVEGAGFTSVVATDCDQEYARYLRPGDLLVETKTIDAISEEKQTALGVGHFITTTSTYADQSGEVVGVMRFRILKFKPGTGRGEPAAPPRARRPRPALTGDDAWWFEACREHRLLIQRCASCGVLRHPPEPACGGCGSFESDTVAASGRGSVYSFVLNHHPQVASFDDPLPTGLIELEEGTRLVADLVGIEPAEIVVGMPVQVTFVDHDDELTLPAFQPVR